MHKLLQSRVAAVSVGALVVVGLGAGGAVAANMVTSHDIRNQSVRGVDIARGTIDSSELRNQSIRGADINNNSIGASELRSDAIQRNHLDQRVLNQMDNRDDVNGLRHEVEELEARVDALEQAEDQGGSMNTNWVANAGSTIVDANTVELTKTETDSSDATSVEIEHLDVGVQAGDPVSFDYTLSNGAVCTAGAPRVFVENMRTGDFTNSWDQLLPEGKQCGEDTDGDGTFTVTFNVPENGRIGQAGVVYDAGSAGTVTVTDVTVGTTAVQFQ